MAHWWAAEIIQRKWRKEAPDIKLRQMGRYDELLNTRGNIGTLTRALAILERQDKRFVSATNNSGALELVRQTTQRKNVCFVFQLTGFVARF
jgi:hypothetical protein